MSRSNISRAAVLAACAASSALAAADVRYTFSGALRDSSGVLLEESSFSLVVPSLITSIRKYSLAELESYSFEAGGVPATVTSVTIAPQEQIFPAFVEIGDDPNQGTIYSFADDAFRGYGTFETPDRLYAVGTATVEAVPEPASMAALGLGAAAMLRRRKKA